MGNYVVTGSASGIGQATKRMLEAQGHEVIGVDVAGAEVNADLSNREQSAGVIEEIKERMPEGLDGLVPCAGLGPDCKRRELIALVNYFAVVDIVEGLRERLAQRQGAVVLISSNSAQIMQYDEAYMEALLNDDRSKAIEIANATDGQTVYGAGKQALARWMRRVNERFAKCGIRMNAIAPGFTQTGMTESGLEDPEYGEAIAQFVESIPLGRKGLPEDQANAIDFLLSDRAGFISGAVLFVDGGHDALFRPDSF